MIRAGNTKINFLADIVSLLSNPMFLHLKSKNARNIEAGCAAASGGKNDEHSSNSTHYQSTPSALTVTRNTADCALSTKSA
jgi:hypothetical protein